MKILYVTSFAEDMYRASGQYLINSYLKTQQAGDFLVCYENFKFSSNSKRIKSFNIGDSKFLRKWLRSNADVIPDYLGGKATKKNNPKLFDSPANRKASRWFRKIASLEYALSKYGHKYQVIIWIDSDCQFIRSIPSVLIKQAFRGKYVFYHNGPKRIRDDKGIESGFIGFRQPIGYQHLRSVFQCYTSKAFRKVKRWDDGYIFRHILEPLSRDCVDLAVHCKTKNPIQESLFRNYIIHHKGKHNGTILV